MVQKLFGFGMGATGIVGTLIIAGIILKVTKVAPELGTLAITGGVVIGIVLGMLGILGVAKRLF